MRGLLEAVAFHRQYASTWASPKWGSIRPVFARRSPSYEDSAGWVWRREPPTMAFIPVIWKHLHPLGDIIKLNRLYSPAGHPVRRVPCVAICSHCLPPCLKGKGYKTSDFWKDVAIIELKKKWKKLNKSTVKKTTVKFALALFLFKLYFFIQNTREKKSLLSKRNELNNFFSIIRFLWSLGAKIIITI